MTIIVNKKVVPLEKEKQEDNQKQKMKDITWLTEEHCFIEPERDMLTTRDFVEI